jgi:hypothetical protein
MPERIILSSMKKRLSVGVLLCALSLIPVTPQTQEKPAPEANPPLEAVPSPQEFQARKPKDYMSSFFSRDTKPLGLKEDQALKKLLREPAIKWACRTGTRHILD